MGHVHPSVDEQLKVDAAHAVCTVVFDILGPGLALDVDEDPCDGLLEVDEHKGREVAVQVGEGEVVLGDGALVGVVADRTDVLFVGRVL